MFPQLRTR